MKIKKFNESKNKELTIRVKNIIEYLQQFDPNTEVSLDKDGWESGDNEIEIIENSGIFEYFDDDDPPSLFINN